jgi:hypothetical protein
MPVKMLRVSDHVGGRVPQATVLALKGRRVVQHIDESRLTPGDKRFLHYILLMGQTFQFSVVYCLLASFKLSPTTKEENSKEK